MKLCPLDRSEAGFYHFPYSKVGAILGGVSSAGIFYPFQGKFRIVRYLLVAFVVLGWLICFLEHRWYRRKTQAIEEAMREKGQKRAATLDDLRKN